MRQLKVSEGQELAQGEMVLPLGLSDSETHVLSVELMGMGCVRAAVSYRLVDFLLGRKTPVRESHPSDAPMLPYGSVPSPCFWSELEPCSQPQP